MSAKLAFTSKADVLSALCDREELHIPRPLAIRAGDWRENPAACLERAAAAFDGDALLATRSSCRREDGEGESGAGAFLSLLNVENSPEALSSAIDAVIASYGEFDPDDQVLIQPMIENPVVSGVIMTRSLTDGSPYFVINYDDESGKTDTITGGKKTSKTVFVWRDVKDGDFDSPRLRSFVELARKVENICGSDALDIEFCLDAKNILHLLQVRPISASRNWSAGPDRVSACLDRAAAFTRRRLEPVEGLFGKSSILGVMPDWNPAEMIGIMPSPLAASLYRNLITARVWSEARELMGYREMPPAELMILILGRPYIDVRASFNSFLPAGLDPVTSEALVSAWLERLGAKPELHDKIEFEIAQTVLDFSFDDNLAIRYPGLLTAKRRESFRSALLALTSGFLNPASSGTLAIAYEAATELRMRQAGRALPGPDSGDRLDLLPVLLEECRKLGTLPFSVLARHAFAAESLLRSAVAKGALAAERLAQFKLSLMTISGEMSREFQEVCSGGRDSAAFMRKYGHLRPGSYDILSPRYADRKGLFSQREITAFTGENPRFEPTAKELAEIDVLLATSGFKIDARLLLDYAARAIKGRELAKFIFSRNLSDALELIAAWGATEGFSREELSWLDVHSLLNWLNRALPENAQTHFRRKMEINRELAASGAAIKLGYLIRSPGDVYIAPQHRSAPNYIGSGEFVGEVARLSAESSCDVDLKGKLVCIENADPGFDWIFTRGIGGLVTKFGGANSHMAIRCAEYGLPAAIGAGEQLFGRIASRERARLNPGASILAPA